MTMKQWEFVLLVGATWAWPTVDVTQLDLGNARDLDHEHHSPPLVR